MAEARIDKWMWAVRIFKTRTIAAEACKKGRITINGSLAKAARMIKPGDVIQVKKPPITYSFKVLQTIEKRVGAKLVSEMMENVTTPDQYELLEMSKMIFSDFKLFYQTIYPGDEDSPLKASINDTKVLKLKYNQNIFSLQVSSINYDYPSNILYSWRLEGFYDKWSKPGTENTIRYTNLAPGKYTLRVRAISNEDKRIMLEERSMDIIIAQPFWLTFWAMLVYTAILCLIAIVLLRILILRKQRKVSDEKIHFFINTAHDIRTPLTLIKAPLEELREKEELS